MADYTSNLVAKKTRHRGIYSGKPYTVNARFFFPDGTVLVADDRLLAVPLGENQMVVEVTTLTVGPTGLAGDTGASAASLGYFQMLDGAGDPVVIERQGPFGEAATKYESPVTDGDAFKAAGQLDGYVEANVAAPVKLAGPVIMGGLVTTGGTITGDTELFIGCTIHGETSMRDTVGGGSDNAYLLDPDQGTDPTP